MENNMFYSVVWTHPCERLWILTAISTTSNLADTDNVKLLLKISKRLKLLAKNTPLCTLSKSYDLDILPYMLKWDLLIHIL